MRLLREVWELSECHALDPISRAVPISNAFHNFHRNTCPYGSSKTWSAIYGLWIDPKVKKKKKTQFGRPSLLPQTWKTHLQKRKPSRPSTYERPGLSLSVFMQYCMYSYDQPFCGSSAGRGESKDLNCRRAWSTTSRFGISIPGFFLITSFCLLLLFQDLPRMQVTFWWCQIITSL